MRSEHPLIGRFQDAVTPMWSRIGGGCHLNRDTAARIQAAGYTLAEMERFPFSGVAHILGTALSR